MTQDEAITKKCIFGVHSGKSIRPWQSGTSIMYLPDCIGLNCAAYWRWLDKEYTQGYCSLGVKPEF
jgi:hypothetical protein